MIIEATEFQIIRSTFLTRRIVLPRWRMTPGFCLGWIILVERAHISKLKKNLSTDSGATILHLCDYCYQHYLDGKSGNKFSNVLHQAATLNLELCHK